MKQPFNADALAAQASGVEFKKQPIPAGFVRFERHDYNYGQQGQVWLTGYTIKDMPEYEAIKWLSGTCSVTWPDGGIELFDFRVSPARHDCHAGFGTIQQAGRTERTQVKLSRLPNVAVGYYNPILITADERATFVQHVN